MSNIQNFDYESFILFLLVYMVIVFLVVFLKKYLNIKDRWTKVIYIIIVSMPFSIMAGLRCENVGYDTQVYILNFINLERVSSDIFIDGGPFRYLYYLFIRIIFFLTDANINVFLFSMAFLTIYLILYSFLVREMNYKAWGLVLFLLYLAPRMLDQSRQFMAIAFFSLALISLYKKKNVKAIFYMFVGGMIHESLLIFIPLYLFAYFASGYKKYIVLFIMFIVALLYLESLMSLIIQFLPENYLYIEVKQKVDGGVNGLFWVLDVLPLLVSLSLFYYKRKSINTIGNTNYIEFIAWTGILFRLLAYYSYLVMRMYYYGAMAGIFLVSLIMVNDSKLFRKYKIIVVLIYILFWMIALFKFNMNGVLPYEYCIYCK